MLTDQELQSLRNLGNEAEAAADEIERLRAELAQRERGECICLRCGLRELKVREDDGPEPEFMF